MARPMDQHNGKASHIHALGHQQSAPARKADHRANGQIDVAAGQDTQKHTAGQNEDVRFGDQVGNVLGNRISAGLPRKNKNTRTRIMTMVFF